MKPNYKKAWKNNHYADLEKLGATDGKKAYATLRRIEKDAHRLAEYSCNYEIEESREEHLYTLLERRVKRVFNGTLPDGFFFNCDPRGYSLKIKTEKNQMENGQRVINQTDWGDYGLLAPSF